jgi:hypothetical protein
MASHINASDLVKTAIQEAIDKKYNIRERYEDEKKRFNENFITESIHELKTIIEKNPTDRSKWYIEMFLDKKTIETGISIRRLGLDENELSMYQNRIKYLNIEQCKAKFEALGYELKEDILIVNCFCASFVSKVIHRLSIKY